MWNVEPVERECWSTHSAAECGKWKMYLKHCIELTLCEWCYECTKHCSIQALLFRCTWFIDHLQVWAPLKAEVLAVFWPYISVKNMTARLQFPKWHLNKLQDFWNNVLWTDKTELEMLEKPNAAYWQKHFILTFKDFGEGVDWACFAATRPGHHTVIKSTMNSVYQSILQSSVRPSVQQLKLGWNWVMQQGKDSTAANL